MSPDDALVFAALDQVEQLEARLLSWGLVDAFVPVADLQTIVGDQVDRLETFEGLTLTTVDAVVDRLVALGLVFGYFVTSIQDLLGDNPAVAQVLADEYLGGPPGNGDEVRAIYEKYSAALTGGGQQTINMDLVLEF